MGKKTSLADNIRIIRENLEYSQEYVATKLGITQQTYSNIEKDPEKATVKRLKEIADILQVSFVTLLDEDDVYILQNFHQQGGNAATQATIQMNASNSEKEIYDKLITELKDQINFLRELTKK
ncbi:helix-turn-helix transcriptional regulator [Fluviicola sp.]|jgi:transcriptional regulator with XRE-family HTH domain|uniref:helix-turn-helix domain-containing protein n=1 Tax=Fluviicola sp. TaxID=1917219 RepID=UPI00282EA587|nr:helix-turn-helix transcriptional regulator [Fluviicola sp.]MDR0801581.1 helix-turn-helix domain-containing protein [Fluviicola sp.]